MRSAVPSRLWSKLSRFSLVGVLATVTYFVSTNLLAMSNSVSPQVASICGYAMGMFVSFFGQSRYTFAVGANSWGQVRRFVVLSIGGFLFSWGGVYLAVEWLKVSVFWGSLATAAIIPATNFVVMNCWVFSEE